MDLQLAEIPYDLDRKAVPIRIDESNIAQLIDKLIPFHRHKTCPISCLLNLYLKPDYCVYTGSGTYSVREITLTSNNEGNRYFNAIWSCEMSLKVQSWVTNFDNVTKGVEGIHACKEITDSTILLDKVGALETWMWLPASMLD